MTNIFIPGNVPSSKNSKQWTGKFLISSKNTLQWRIDTKVFWEKYKQDFLDMVKDLPKPYKVEFTFTRKSKHKFDYVNILQAPLDEMVKYGWIDDDNADEIKPYFGDYSYDKDNPGVTIKII